MLGGKKKKKAAKLAAEQEKMKQIMKEAGVDMGPDAKQIAKEGKKDKVAASGSAVVKKGGDIAASVDDSASKGTRKMGDVKRKVGKIGKKMEVEPHEERRREKEYDPCRMSVKETKDEWAKLAKLANNLAKALEKQEQSERELFEVLAKNIASDPSRLVIGAVESEKDMKKEAKKEKKAAKKAEKKGEVNRTALKHMYSREVDEGEKFRQALWTAPSWQLLARCNAGGVDAGNKIKFLSEEFHPVREAAVEGNAQVRKVESLKREYWDQKEEADANRAAANKAQKDVEKAQGKQEKTQEKYLAKMEAGKSKKANKILQGDKTNELIEKARMAEEQWAASHALMMEKERKFNMAATKLREDHEHCALQAFFHHNRALIKASQAEVDSIARLSLSGEAYGYVQPLPWRPALALSTPGNDPAATTRNFACRTDVVQTVDMPNLAAVALITPSHISVVDAESLQLRYEVQLDWLTHIIGISSIQEKMRTADWFDPLKMGKKTVVMSAKMGAKALEQLGVMNPDEVLPPVTCAIEVGARLWFGCDTGHICAIQSTAAVLEAVVEPEYDSLTESFDEAAITSIAGHYHAVNGALVIWAGKTDGTITVLQFNNIADVASPPTKITKLDPPVQESNKRGKVKVQAVTSLSLAPDGQHMWAQYGSKGFTLWDASRLTQGIEWQDASGVVSAALVGREHWRGLTDSTVHVYDALSGNKVTVLMPYKDAGPVTAMSSDGYQVWALHENKEIRVIDRGTKQVVKTLFVDQPTPIMLARPRSRVPSVWTCADDGTVTVWNAVRCVATAPPTVEEQLALRAPEYTKPSRVRLRAMSWSVGDVPKLTSKCKADLATFLGGANESGTGMSLEQCDVLVIGLQGARLQTDAVAAMWEEALLDACPGFSVAQVASYTSLLLFVLSSSKQANYVTELTTQCAGCEFMNREENGAGVAIHCRIHETHFSFVNCKLTPGQGQVSVRNLEVAQLSEKLLPRDIDRRVIWVGDLGYRIDGALDTILEAAEALKEPETLTPQQLTSIQRSLKPTGSQTKNVMGGIGSATAAEGGGGAGDLALSDRVKGGEDDGCFVDDYTFGLGLAERVKGGNYIAAELPSMKLAALRKLAMAEEGIDDDAVDDAMEADNPKEAVIQLLKAKLEAEKRKTPVQRGYTAAQLPSMKFGALARLAEAEGVDEDKIDSCANSDDPKQALNALLVEMLPPDQRGLPEPEPEPDYAAEAAEAARVAREEEAARIAAQEAAAKERIVALEEEAKARIAAAEAEAKGRIATEAAAAQQAKEEAAAAELQATEAAAAAKKEQEDAAAAAAAAAQAEADAVAKAEADARAEADAAAAKAAEEEAAAATAAAKAAEEEAAAAAAQAAAQAAAAAEAVAAAAAQVEAEAAAAAAVPEGVPPEGDDEYVDTFAAADSSSSGAFAGEYKEEPYEVVESYKARSSLLSTLLDADQLVMEAAARRVFKVGDGWREPEIRFAPTFKYNAGKDTFKTSGPDGEELPGWSGRIVARGAPWVTKRGLLLKLGGKNQDKWQRRSVSLGAEEMNWDNNKLRKEDIGSVSFWHDPNFTTGFSVVSAVKEGKTYHFAAASEADRDEWMAAINSMIRDNAGTKVMVEEDITYESGTHLSAQDINLGSHRPVKADFAAKILVADKKVKNALAKELQDNAAAVRASEEDCCICSLECQGGLVHMGKLTHGASAHRSCTIRNRGAVPVAICILPEVDKEPARWLSFTGAHATIEPGGVHTVGISATIDSYDASQLVKCGGLMEANLRIFCLTAVQNQTPDLPRSSSKLSLKVHGRYNCASLFGRPLQSLAVMAWPNGQTDVRLRKVADSFGIVLSADGSVSSTSGDAMNNLAADALVPGIQIVKVNGRPVHGKDSVIAALGGVKDGETADFTVQRPDARPSNTVAAKGATPAVIEAMVNFVVRSNYGKPGGTPCSVDSMSGEVRFLVAGTAAPEEIDAVSKVLDDGRKLDGLPPTFVPAVARALMFLLKSLPRPVFPARLLPLAGECGGQLDYHTGLALIEACPDINRAVVKRTMEMCQVMAERPGFSLAGMAPALAEALMQPLAPFALEAEQYFKMMLEGPAPLEQLAKERELQMTPPEMNDAAELKAAIKARPPPGDS